MVNNFQLYNFMNFITKIVNNKIVNNKTVNNKTVNIKNNN
jgi:hypothetical protein